MTTLDNSKTNQNAGKRSRQSGIAFVEAAFVALAAGIVLIGIFYWLVPASTFQYKVARGREGIGLSSTIGLTVGRLGEGGERVDVDVAADSAQTLAEQLLSNSGLPACAQAYEVRSTGSPGSCNPGAPTPLNNGSETLRNHLKENSCGAMSSLVLPKIRAVADAECLGVAYYIAGWYVELNEKPGQQAIQKASFQPVFPVLSGGT